MIFSKLLLSVQNKTAKTAVIVTSLCCANAPNNGLYLEFINKLLFVFFTFHVSDVQDTCDRLDDYSDSARTRSRIICENFAKSI